MSEIFWIDSFKYAAGEPFRVFPIGQFKRGGRTLDLSEARLQSMASNYEANRPRWKIPIYFGHPTDAQPDPPKQGNAARLEFIPGKGLYAYPDYSDSAKKALEAGEYQYVSPGVLWSLAGQLYTDEQGVQHDNVLDHIAFTNRPWFGERTSLFSSDESIIRDIEKFTKGNSMAKEDEVTAEQFDAKLKEMSDKFDAQLKAQELQLKVQQDKYAADIAAAKSDAEKFSTQLASEKKLREMNELRTKAEAFSNLPVSVDEYADKFWALTQVSPELATWFNDKFSQFDLMVSQGSLFSQVSRQNAQVAGVETIETVAAKIVKDEFGGDNVRFADALIAAGVRRPDLVPTELRNVRGARRSD